MATLPFRAVSWSPSELIDEGKMDQLASNVNYVRDHSLSGRYTLPGGARRVENLKLAGGKLMIGRSKSDNGSGPVRFGTFFSAGCDPIVTYGVVADFQRKIFCTINGFGRLQPDHRGFQAFVNVAAEGKKQDKIKGRIWVHWQALGY